MTKLSVVLATYNEEKNLSDCLASVKNIATEIIVVDGSSTDRTVQIAKEFNAKVLVTTNPANFHINKQKALEMAHFEWILQLDADERVTKPLAKEIEKIMTMDQKEIGEYQKQLADKNLFLRHQELLEKRDGYIGDNSPEYVAFFIPRLNYFLGKYLRHGGVYPDGVIRLVRKGKADFPAKDVHEQIAVKGKVGWLQEPLQHKDSPTFARYISRNNKYTDLMAQNMQEQKIGKNATNYLRYVVLKPLVEFLTIYIRHKGFLDSWQGLIWAFFSARRFAVAYQKYLHLI